jgi:preprotein translocase subunit SecG
MSMTTVVIVVAVAAIIALVLLGRDSGPRITTIERDREIDRKEDRDA